MVCRSTPGNSGITSLARHNSGLLDVQVLSMFHEVRASQPRDLTAPTEGEVHHFLDGAAARARRAQGLSSRERNQIIDRIRRATSVMPDGRTYYAWRNIEDATTRARAAMDTHFQSIARRTGDTPEQVQAAFNTLMRRDHRIDGQVPAAPEHVDYFTDNTPRDRGTRYALAMLYLGAARHMNDPERLASIYRHAQRRSEALGAAQRVDDPAHQCPDCGQFAADDHTCPDVVAADTLTGAALAGAAAEAAALDTPTPAPSDGQVASLHLLTDDEARRMAAAGVIQREDGLYESGLGVCNPDRSVVIEAAAQRLVNRDLRNALRADLGSAMEAQTALDILDGRVIGNGRGYWYTSDGGSHARLADALLYEARLPGARCDDCGRYQPADGSHACDPLTAWEQELRTQPATGQSEAEVQAAIADLRERLTGDPNPQPGPVTPVREPAAGTQPAATPDATPTGQARRAPTPVRNYRAEDGVVVRILNVSALRNTLRSRPGEQYGIDDLRATFPGGEGSPRNFIVTGTLTGTDTGMRRTRTRDRYRVENPASLPGAPGLRCTCPDYAANYDCMHVRQTVEHVQALLNQRDAVAVAPVAAMATVGADLREEYDASLAASQQHRADFAAATDGVAYADNMAEFQTAWDAAKAHFESGNHRLPYLIENATNGLGAREGGRSFGLEIEVDFPEDLTYEAKNRVAREIYEAGLSDSDQVRPWHWRARQTDSRGRSMGGGYTDNPNMWSVEFDRSVDDVGGNRGCEIVSPILYDTPDTWRNLATITEIVERNGGKVTPRTGLHVNVGAADYDHTVENHNRLIGLANAYEDVIVRTAHNPQSAPNHRGREYCRPMTMPAAGYSSIRQAQRNLDPRSDNGSSHRAMINLDHVPSEGMPVQNSTRVEVRIFDGALDPGRIQANVKLSLGLVDAAVRGVEVPEDAERAGTHRTRNVGANGRARRLRGADWENDTRSFRTLMDTVFTRAEDKRQLTYAFASSRWQAR